MTTVAILSSRDESGHRMYRAISGDKQSVGKTAGEALDALTAELAEDLPAMLLIQSVGPDRFFGAAQQQRLAELMELWHSANDQGLTLAYDLQNELDSLVAAELRAATARSAEMLSQINRES
ncbi:hypothetical protein ACQ4N7_09370 [Nodosilinea sp. AN01ver1]|uniref:hypothetical protein n=1 Tax=Nodosilinea sp. AN01ver1 TaxID=3423362 RepID=UPI003D31D2B5